MPKKRREGDLIAVAAGSQIPIVLRSRRVEEYEVVGACYIHGIMDSEGLDDGRGKMEMVVLCLVER